MRNAKKKFSVESIPSKSAFLGTSSAMDDMVATKRGVRCCVECKTTQTPQWREGPCGPKTLCNACGVRRQRQLRRGQQAVAVQPEPMMRQPRKRQLEELTSQAQALLQEYETESSSDGEMECRYQDLESDDSEYSEEHLAAINLLVFAGVAFLPASCSPRGKKRVSDTSFNTEETREELKVELKCDEQLTDLRSIVLKTADGAELQQLYQLQGMVQQHLQVAVQDVEMAHAQ